MKLFLALLLIPALALAQTTHYDYTVADDIVAQEFDGALLSLEISESTTITTELTRWGMTGPGVMRLSFAAPLSAPEKTALDGDTTGPCGGLVGAHDPGVVTPAITTPSSVILEAGSPGTGDDLRRGIQTGWIWLDTDTSQVWLCTSNAINSASWVRLDT